MPLPLARLLPGGVLLADKSYDTEAIRAETAERGAFADVPPRVIRKGTRENRSSASSTAPMRGLATRHAPPG